MDPRAIEAVIAKRFGLARAPTLVARVAAAKLPVVFTHLRSTEAGHRDGVSRRSEEGPVMGLERRGDSVWLDLRVNPQGEEPDGASEPVQ